MSLAVLASRALSGAHAHVVRVETHLGPDCRASMWSACPMLACGKAANGCAPPSSTAASSFLPAASPSTCRRPTCPESGRFDLPIALGLLLASGQLPEPPSAGDAGGKPSAMPASESMLARLVLAGELSLTGALTPVTAPLLIALGVAGDQPDATLVLPAGSAEQAAWVPGLRVLSARSLADVAAHITGAHALPDAVPAPWPEPPPVPCLSDVRGQPARARAGGGGRRRSQPADGGAPGRARACWRSGCRACCRRCRARRRWRPLPWRRWPVMRRRPRAAAIPGAASFPVRTGAGGWRHPSPARRDQPGASRRAVPGRTLG